jgi:hypothetical protein
MPLGMFRMEEHGMKYTKRRLADSTTRGCADRVVELAAAAELPPSDLGADRTDRRTRDTNPHTVSTVCLHNQSRKQN